MSRHLQIGDILPAGDTFRLHELARGAKTDWLGFAVSGKEFDAMDDLEAFGIAYWRGIRIEFERRGKNRTAEPFEYPYLRNYLRIRPTHAQVRLLSRVRYLGGTFMPLSKEAGKQFDALAERADAAVEQANRAAGNRKAIADYAAFKPGDPLEIREGALASEMARFVKLIQRPHDLFPVILAEMDVMGRTTMVEFDPLAVRKPKGA